MQRFGNEKMRASIWGKLECAYGFRMQHLPAQTVRYCMASVFVFFKVNTAKRAHSEARGAKLVASCVERYRVSGREEAGI